MTRKRHTVGIIGLGYGRAHIAAFQAHHCDVVALCQRDRAKAETVAELYGVPRVFERWEDLLEQARPEIVVVATPPHLHAEIAHNALAAGAHVLCEKPLAMTPAEAAGMAETAARSGRVTVTAFNWRYPAAMRRLHAMVEEGFLGRVFHVTARWLGGRVADEASPLTWRNDRSLAGHGAMGDMGVHVIDLIRWSFGEFARVGARSGVAYPTRLVTADRHADAEDFSAVTGELRSGAVVNLMVSRVARGTQENALEVYGSRGALAYRITRQGEHWYHGELRAASGGGPMEPVKLTGLRPVAGGEQIDVLGRATIGPLVGQMLEAIESGGTGRPSFEDGARAQAVLEAVRESAARGTWVDVPAQ